MPVTIPEPLIFTLSSPTTPFHGIVLASPKDGCWAACAISADGTRQCEGSTMPNPQWALDSLSEAVEAYLSQFTPSVVLPAALP